MAEAPRVTIPDVAAVPAISWALGLTVIAQEPPGRPRSRLARRSEGSAGGIFRFSPPTARSKSRWRRAGAPAAADARQRPERARRFDAVPIAPSTAHRFPATRLHSTV